MPENEFLPENPDWSTKAIGDLQTAVEMNEVISAFKQNALVLTNLINKIAPQIGLLTEAQLFSTAINEVFNLAIKKLDAPAWTFVEPNAPHAFPAMLRGETKAFFIETEAGEVQPKATFWLGGYSGIQVSHQALLICIIDSPGGTFQAHGHRYLLINQKAITNIVRKPTFADFPDPGNFESIYIAEDTNITYYWVASNSDLVTGYEPIGNIQTGYWKSSIRFVDEDLVDVDPTTGIRLYYDISTEIYYRWDGAQFLPLDNYNGGGGGSVDLSHLLEGNIPKYDPNTENLENSVVTERNNKIGIGTVEPTEALDVDGKVKANAVKLNNTSGTTLPNEITRDGDKLNYTNSAGVKKEIAFTEQVVKVISSNTTLDDSYHNAIVRITASATITVPNNLRSDFNCVFDVLGLFTGTFTEGSGTSFSAPFGKLLKNNNMCTLYKTGSASYRINGPMELV